MNDAAQSDENEYPPDFKFSVPDDFEFDIDGTNLTENELTDLKNLIATFSDCFAFSDDDLALGC